MKRAVIYIRVSTKQQAVRDGNPEGYSLPTQRDACVAQAEQLDAVVVDEYVDKDTGTAVNKRPAMQQLLERIERLRDVDYVIVYKLDRWARNTREDLISDFVLEVASCALVSCSEGIDRTAAGRLLHSMLASVNEYHSRNQSDEIKRKSLQKVMNGGTMGPAPLGYRNVGEGGRRYVVIDPEPAALIQWAFAAYATGEWTVTTLRAELTERGLKSRGGPNSPQRELSISQLHRLLSNPYFKGFVRHNGVLYPGKHEPLIEEETWQRVQDMLASKARGEKQRTHHHYLKGTIFCGHCGSRLCVCYARGKLGVIYPYYFCLGRQQKRTTCMLTYRPIDVVERQIEDHYLHVRLNAKGLERTGEAVLEELSQQQAVLSDQRKRQAQRLERLEAEQTALLQAHYAGAVPLELLKREQTRMSEELTATRGLLEVSVASSERLDFIVREASRRAVNCHASYLASAARERQLMNQAFFKRVLVTEDGVVGWEYQEPFSTLMSAHSPTPHVAATLLIEHEDAQSGEDEDHRHSLGLYQRRRPGTLTRAFCRSGSKAEHLAEREGFEPSKRLDTP